MPKDECLIIVNTSNPIRDKKYKALSHPRWKETFDDHNEDQLKNELQIGRIFHIEQKKENLISVAMPEKKEEPAKGIPTAGRQADPRMAGNAQRYRRDPHTEYAPKGQVFEKNFGPKQGAAFLDTLTKAENERIGSRPQTAEERMEMIKSIAEPEGTVPVSHLPEQDRSVLLRALKSGIAKIEKAEPPKPPKIVMSEADAIDSLFS